MSNIDTWLSDLDTLNPADQDHLDDTTAKPKLDLFTTVLPAIDRGDKGFYSRLSAEEQSSVEPWILMRWLSSVASDQDQPYALLTTNDFVNQNFQALASRRSQGTAGHRHLQWMLLCLCGTGRNVRRKFIKPPRAVKKNRLEQAISDYFPSLSSSEIELMLTINSDEEISEFFVENGYSDADIAEMFKSRK